jgi:hypothetical protein
MGGNKKKFAQRKTKENKLCRGKAKKNTFGILQKIPAQADSQNGPPLKTA